MSRRAVGLTGLAPYLSGPLLQEALAAARAIESELYRAPALVGLAPYLSGSLLQEALAAARAVKEMKSKAYLWPEAPQRSEPLREALAKALALEEEWRRTYALTDLVSDIEHLPATTLYPFWCETLRILASRTRHDFLSLIKALFPVITALGGQEALVATAQAIIEVGKWFP